MVAMVTLSRSSIKLIFCLAVLLLSPLPNCSADPDPLQDLCVADLEGPAASANDFPCKPASQVTSDDFFFDGLSKAGNTKNVFGSNVTVGNVLAFPGLNTMGISMNRVDLTPGGVNPPHSHPRATEYVLVMEGKVLVGFVTTGNVFYSKVLSSGQAFVIPQGLVHFQLNVGEGKALIFTAFNSQLPGAVVHPLTLFASTPSVPNDVLSKAFQVEEDVINGIKSKFGF